MEFIRDQAGEWIAEQLTSVRSLMRNKRLFLFSVANLAMIVFSALMLWKGLIAVTGSDSPVVVVLSGSMEPAFQRGDVLLLDNNRPEISVGDIVVFKIAGAFGRAFGRRGGASRSRARRLRSCRRGAIRPSVAYIPPSAGRDIPIVHRVLRAHVRVANASSMADDAADYLTKGDNNAVDDRNLYAPGQLWLRRSEIIGRAVASVPFVGMMTILLNDYPALKYALVGLMGVFVLLGKD